MKPPPFKYVVPTTLTEALSQLAEYGYEAKPLAGGQSLIPTMNFRLAQPAVLVDLNPISELAYIRPTDNGGVSIGAMTRQREVEQHPLIADRLPLVRETMPHIAHFQIRNRGTFGGNIAHADPASELPAVMLALNARLRLQSATGDRWVAADEFFVDLFATALEPAELLVEIVIPPLPARTGYAFREVARRPGDYAIVGVAATVTLAENGLCQAAKLVYFSVGPKPILAAQATTHLQGQKMTPETIRAAAEIAATQEIDPHRDIHASASYRRHLANVLAQQALETAVSRI